MEPDLKPGWKTTEFWGSLAAAAIPLLNQAFGWNLPTEAIVSIVLAVAGYAISRGIAKRAQ